MAFLKSIWKANSKHKKLSEELALQSAKEAESEQTEIIENENDVITFKLKYLGSTVVEKILGDNINTEAVKNIIKVAKAGRKKLQRVNIAVSLKGLVVTDLQGNDIFKVSIYRISNCATDPTHRQVFSFVSTDENETMECHAFICSKRKMADTVTLAVAQAFSTAYEAWRILPATKEFEKKGITLTVTKENEKNKINETKEEPLMSHPLTDNKVDKPLVEEEKLIDFDDDPIMMEDNMPSMSFSFQKPSCADSFNAKWVCFDDDFVSGTQRSAFKTDLILA